MGYFSSFPDFVYANTNCVDITRRCRVLSSVRSNPFSYYPYTVKEGLRADTIASKYYNDEMRSWMVFTSMDIVDPYYEYPLSNEQFSNYIIDKYGSTANAQSRINYWELNWSDDDGNLSPSGFGALPDFLKKYYNANYGVGANIISYSRRKVDWLTTTNMIVTYQVTSNSAFQDKELIQIRTGNTVIGNAEVAWSNTSTVIVQNIFGATPASNASIVGLTSNVVATINQVIYTSNCIAVDERTFWEPVTFWDHELTIHEGRKYIKLIDSKYTTQMENELINLLNDQPFIFGSGV
jgi:hypothetical protein